ncbi:MAG: hypothetical protein JWM12_1943 [Ilumatobacteraceae bacterium]|nr:hypothetical protein [Ilumatobacteraceae bacterium]
MMGAVAPGTTAASKTGVSYDHRGGRDTVRVRARRVSATASVLCIWALSRVVVAAGLTLGYSWSRGVVSGGGFFVWDGRWYRQIALLGYGGPPRAGIESPWPFFPLLPGLVHLVRAVGLSDVAVLVANHLLFLVALLGVRRLADRHFGRDVTRWSIWALAVFPMSGVFSMLYPSAIFLAASVWAFELAEQRRWGCSGLAACAATMVRPNGLIVVIVLAVATLSAQPARRRLSIAARLAGPSAVAIALWTGFCWQRTGNPFVFVSAKSAWDEVTAIGFGHRVVDDLQFDSVMLHVVIGVVAATALWVARDRLPRSWVVLGAITVTLPLVTGLLGLGRYSNECFPVGIAGGVLLVRLPPRARSTVLIASTAGSFAVAVAMASQRLLP